MGVQSFERHKAGLPIDDIGRRRIDEQLKLVPLLREHFPAGESKRTKS